MKQRLYRVNLSVPSKTGYTTNRNRTVLTTDVVRAVELINKETPDATIWSISHLGAVDLIDPALRGEGEK